MGNRQSFTEQDERDNRPSESLQEENLDDGDDDEDDSYGVKEYVGVELAKNDILKVDPLLDNTDESNNTHTQSESNSSNQSFASGTTTTRYGETNSVVSSDFDSEGSWSDVGERSKTNTASKNSIMYDTDDLTALTDLAHYGDDEGTKNTWQQAKKKRRSKWLRMIQAQQQVKVDHLGNDGEVEAILDNDDDHSLQSMFQSLKSMQRTDGDEETTIHIIDADEEYSRCSSYNIEHVQQTSNHEATHVVSANDDHLLTNDNPRLPDRSTPGEIEPYDDTLKSDIVVNDDIVIQLVDSSHDLKNDKSDTTNVDTMSKSPITKNCKHSIHVDDEDGNMYTTKEIENNLAQKEEMVESDPILDDDCKFGMKSEKETAQLEDENYKPILLVSGLVGDPVEVNVIRQSTISQNNDAVLDVNILRPSSSSNHIGLSVASASFSTNSKSLTSRKADPSGMVVRGKDAPERNKPKVTRKLLDDVELNPRRVEVQRHALLGTNTTTKIIAAIEGSTDARRQALLESNMRTIHAAKADGPYEAIHQAAIASNLTSNISSKSERSLLSVISTVDKIEGTVEAKQEVVHVENEIRRIENNVEATVAAQPIYTERTVTSVTSEKLVDNNIHESIPPTRTTKGETNVRVIHSIDPTIARDIKNVPSSSMRLYPEKSQLLIVQAQDVHAPTMFINPSTNREVIVDKVNDDADRNRTRLETIGAAVLQNESTKQTIDPVVAVEQNACRYSNVVADVASKSESQSCVEKVTKSSMVDSDSNREETLTKDERLTDATYQDHAKMIDTSEIDVAVTNHVVSKNHIHINNDSANNGDNKIPFHANDESYAQSHPSKTNATNVPRSSPLKDVPIIMNGKIIGSSATWTKNKNQVAQENIVKGLRLKNHDKDKAPFDEDFVRTSQLQLRSTKEPERAIKHLHNGEESKNTGRNIQTIGDPTAKLRDRPSPRRIIIRPESLYIETTTIINNDVEAEGMNKEIPVGKVEAEGTTREIGKFVSSKKKLKPSSPKPENEDNRIRKNPSRISKNQASDVDIIADDDDDIDLTVVHQYDETFNELLQRHPEFMIQDPLLVETIRVAKLQKILSATFEMERELEDYVKSLYAQKKEVSAHYHKKLLEASQKKAAREVQAQEELDTLKSSVKRQARNNEWELLSVYKDHCRQCQQLQEHVNSQVMNSDDPLSFLPEYFSEEKAMIMDALMTTYDADNFDEETMRKIRNENVALLKEATKLEIELCTIKQSLVTKDQESFDSMLSSMDEKQFASLKQLHLSNQNR